MEALKRFEMHNVTSSVTEAWAQLVEGLKDGFAHQPVLTTAKCVGAVVATKVAVDYARYLVGEWRINWNLRSLPRAAGRLPFFGHALALNVESPWDVMESWIKNFNYQPMALEYFGRVSTVACVRVCVCVCGHVCGRVCVCVCICLVFF